MNKNLSLKDFNDKEYNLQKLSEKKILIVFHCNHEGFKRASTWRDVLKKLFNANIIEIIGIANLSQRTWSEEFVKTELKRLFPTDIVLLDWKNEFGNSNSICDMKIIVDGIEKGDFIIPWSFNEEFYLQPESFFIMHFVIREALKSCV